MNLSNRYPSLCGKIVFITGGATGIGSCFVECFVMQGAKVVFVDLLETESLTLIDSIIAKKPDADVRFFQCDLLDIEKLKQIINTVEVEVGNISVLINSAANDTRHNFKEVSVKDWDCCININLRHYFFAIQAVQQQMVKNGGGSIINMGSMSWHDHQGGMPGYTAAKAGVVGLTRGFASELGKDKIRINTITPGWVMTKRQLTHWVNENTVNKIEENQCIKDYVMPEDIAAMALFLASDDSKLCTAQDFVVDGGWI
ncbi:SDR family oxidoreductase [Thalassotalea sp. G2M2-11]|uniref:SDR family NAD(P)-dependent oxidoreductase n=1 Tax=Thalassotalea sp. G2M2-11 TaxID=2787627 RepID=UPI0019D203FB|nr:SDR family oxidoreductase [Thalassotalea sp. G2M2-11]